MTATSVAATRPGGSSADTSVVTTPPTPAAVGADQAGGRERHAGDDREHLGRLVAGRVEQGDELDQREERGDADEQRQPRLAEQDDGQDERREDERR